MISQSNQNSSANAEDPVSEFERLALIYCQHIRGGGTAIEPFRNGRAGPFARLSLIDQAHVLDRLRREIDIFTEMKAERSPLSDSRRLLWRGLRKLGLTPQSDIFDKIGDEDVVSVYTSENKQIFQNLRFIELVSLTLEEIFCLPWYSYSRRDPEIEKALYALSVDVFTGKIQSTYECPVESHLGEEVNTEGLVRLQIKVKYVSPLSENGRTVAMLVVNHCIPLGGRWNGRLASPAHT